MTQRVYRPWQTVPAVSSPVADEAAERWRALISASQAAGEELRDLLATARQQFAVGQSAVEAVRQVHDLQAANGRLRRELGEARGQIDDLQRRLVGLEWTVGRLASLHRDPEAELPEPNRHEEQSTFQIIDVQSQAA